MIAMGSANVVDAARQSPGPVATYLPVPFASAPPVDLQREAVGRLQRAARIPSCSWHCCRPPPNG
jgi:hypothetical protein